MIMSGVKKKINLFYCVYINVDKITEKSNEKKNKYWLFFMCLLLTGDIIPDNHYIIIHSDTINVGYKIIL